MSAVGSARLLTRRPLVGLSIVFAAGCGLVSREINSAPLLFALVCIFLFSAVLYRKTRWALVALLLAVCCAGALHRTVYQSTSLSPSAAIVPKERLEARGVLSADPVVSQKKGKWQTSLAVTADLFAKGEPRGTTRVRVIVPNDQAARFMHGERWTFTGRYYPYRRSITTYSGVLYADDCERTSAAPWFYRHCAILREKARHILSIGLDDFPTQRGLLQAMLLGYRAEVKGDVRDDFIGSGTLHLFALSGLHVGIIALLLISLLKIAGVSRRFWGLVLLPALWVYVVMTGMRPSTLRAFIMAAVYWGGPLIRRRSDAPTALALAAWIVLIINPSQVVDPGFVLSFGVVGLLILGCAHFRGWLIPEDYGLEGKTLWRNVQFYGRSVLISSVVAWAASFPLALYYFGRASVVGPLANLIAVPLSFMIVLTGGLSLAFGGWLTVAAELLNSANRIFLTVLCEICGACAAVPFGQVEVEKRAVWQIMVWYVAVGLLVQKKKSRRIVGAGLLLVFAGGFWINS